MHKIDLIRWLLQDEFDEVSAFTATLDKRNSAGELIGIDDNVVCILKTKKGLIGTLSNSWTYYGEEDNSTILYGTKGILKIYAHPDFPLELIKRDGSLTHYKVGQIATNNEQVKSGIMDLFVESLIRNEQPPITGVDGLRSIQVVNAILESVETKRTVALS